MTPPCPPLASTKHCLAMVRKASVAKPAPATHTKVRDIRMPWPETASFMYIEYQSPCYFTNHKDRDKERDIMNYWMPDRATTDRFLAPMTGILRHIPGLTPSWLSATGLLFALLASLLLANGLMGWGGILVLASGLMDVFDGYAARTLGLESRRGAFLDSCLDRLADAALFFGLLWHYSGLNDRPGALLVAASMAGALITPYIRAKAEQFLQACKVGVLERPHRMALLIIGLLFGVLKPALWAMLVLSFVTIFQRIAYSLKRLS